MAYERTLARKPLARQTLREAPAPRRDSRPGQVPLVEEVQTNLGNTVAGKTHHMQDWTEDFTF